MSGVTTSPAPAVRASDPGSPLVWLFAGFPLWWALGLGPVCWIAFGLVMAAALLRRRRIRVPRGFGWWLAFCGWVLVSALQVLGPHVLGVSWRMAMYFSATMVFLYVYEHDEREISGERIAGALTALWVATVAGGFLGLLLPGRAFTTPFELLLPGGVTNNPFVRQLVHPQLSSVQVFLGYPVPRPQAPFPYANHWGSVYAVLVPVVLGYVSTRGGRRWRAPLAFVAVASIVPLAFSLNRTAWISLAVGLVYAGFFVMPDRRAQAARVGLVAVVVLAAVVLLTPIGGLLADRAQTGHSDEGRSNLYEQSIDLALESPFVGKGAPQSNVDHDLAPKVGTQGHLWLVLVSQGIVGLVLFMGWIVVLFRRTRRATGTLARWCHVPLLIFLIQLPFYDMLPFQLCIVFATSALALRTVGSRAVGAASPATAVSA